MAKVTLDSKPVMYNKIGPLSETALAAEAEEIAVRARENLATAKSSFDIPDEATAGSTYIEVNKIAKGTSGNKYAADYEVAMVNPDGGAMAIEVGHMPSGKFANTTTRAPRGLYILSRAAGLLGRFTK